MMTDQTVSKNRVFYGLSRNPFIICDKHNPIYCSSILPIIVPNFINTYPVLTMLCEQTYRYTKKMYLYFL